MSGEGEMFPRSLVLASKSGSSHLRFGVLTAVQQSSAS